MNTLVSILRILRSPAGCALMLLILLRIDTSSAASVNAPSTSSNGTYTVTFGTCSIYCVLEEKAGASGTYTYVAGAYGPFPSNAGPGYGQYSASGKPSGVYYYHVGDLYTDFYSYSFYDYSPEVAVVVGSPSPPGDPMSNQAQYKEVAPQNETVFAAPISGAPQVRLPPRAAVKRSTRYRACAGQARCAGVAC